MKFTVSFYLLCGVINQKFFAKKLSINATIRFKFNLFKLVIMTAIPFDTLLFVETLTETGVDEKQAKAISTAVYDSYKTAEFVTKTDFHHEISDLRKDMNNRFAAVDAKLESRFAAVDAKLESLQLHLTLKISSIIGGILIAGLSALGIFMKALISASL